MRFDVSSLFYRWTRDLHLYAGLSAGPFIILFALSAILFNHGWMPWGGVDTPATERTATFTQPPENDDSVVMGKAILRELGVGGEIGSVRRQQNPTRVTLLV
ncbi:MAG: hypothetical protein O3A46_10715, partial [Candidatus Poribacteria bacterium]|nr:hypothetical protein [Candidatus Poribacteria bacterium]